VKSKKRKKVETKKNKGTKKARRRLIQRVEDAVRKEKTCKKEGTMTYEKHSSLSPPLAKEQPQFLDDLWFLV
jgi:hypothetical protein